MIGTDKFSDEFIGWIESKGLIVWKCNGIKAQRRRRRKMKKTISYKDLSIQVGNMVLNNTVHNAVDDFELYCGNEFYEEEGYEDEYKDIYQEYIINRSGAEFLEKYTSEIVYYSEKLDMYIWAITHFGTSWDYVTTEIEW